MTHGPIILAAGGTGGHMFPAEALARALLARGRLVAVVTDARGGTFGDALPGVETFRIRAATIGRGVVGKLRTALALVIGYGQARRLLKALRPVAVVGFGGYASAPTVFAAGRRGVPVLLHEQNAILGRANRMLARSATRIATSFPSVGGVRPGDLGKIVPTGNPVRPGIAAVGDQGYRPPGGGGVRLLVLGGSQGARALSEIVPAALTALPEPLRRRLVVTQQCRAEDLAGASAVYQRARIGHRLDTFFPDVPQLRAEAHLVIARAGASTIAELTAAGRPAILVPYPHATDDHQTANARALADAGGAWLMPQQAMTAATLAERLQALLADPDALSAAAAAARGFGAVDAAARLADAVVALAGLGDNGGRNDDRPERREAAA